MIKVCPKCGSIAEYNSYYGRTTCTSCSWEEEMQELKPCPFCGGEVEIVCIGGGWFWRHKNNPSDTDCVITHSKKYKTYEEAKEHWNRRAKDV